MAATSPQLSCFSSINHKLHLQRRSVLCPIFRPQKSWVAMSIDGGGSNTKSSEIKTSLTYTADESKPYLEGTKNSYPPIEEENAVGETGINEENGATQPTKGAKIHDFCFGIPYGSLVLSGGLIGLIFSRNPSTLRTLMLGGALLTLSTFSLKIWRQGKSSIPYILGQTVISAFLLWKNYETYTLTRKLLPNGFYAVISAAMLCFYTYVMISGGNPPPKKLKQSAEIPSQ